MNEWLKIDLPWLWFISQYYRFWFLIKACCSARRVLLAPVWWSMNFILYFVFVIKITHPLIVDMSLSKSVIVQYHVETKHDKELFYFKNSSEKNIYRMMPASPDKIKVTPSYSYQKFWTCAESRVSQKSFLKFRK